MRRIDQTSGIFTGFSQSTSGFPCQLLFQQYFSFILPSIGAGTVGQLVATVPVSRRKMILMCTPWNLMMDPLRHKIY